MDLFGWLGVVVFCIWRFRVSGDSMGRKMLSDVCGVSPVLFKQVSGILLYIFGPSGPLLPSLPSQWHDPKTLGKEKCLALLWSRP